MTRPRQPLSGQLPEQKKTIRIPVRIRTKGGIEYFYGGALVVVRAIMTASSPW